MVKVVYNDDWWSFGLSDAAIQRYLELAKIPYWKENIGYYSDFFVFYLTPPGSTLAEESLRPEFQADELDRADPILAQIVEELGPLAHRAAGGRFAIRDIPAGSRYIIQEYDGKETIKLDSELNWKHV